MGRPALGLGIERFKPFSNPAGELANLTRRAQGKRGGRPVLGHAAERWKPASNPQTELINLTRRANAGRRRRGGLARARPQVGGGS